MWNKKTYWDVMLLLDSVETPGKKKCIEKNSFERNKLNRFAIWMFKSAFSNRSLSIINKYGEYWLMQTFQAGTALF